MRTTAIVAVLLLSLPACCVAFYCLEPFDGPDGTIPARVSSTGDPSDSGTFSVQSNVFRHTGGGGAHYVLWDYDCWSGPDPYILFLVEGTGWEFAWRITMEDQTSGQCLRFSHGPYSDGWRYTFEDFQWSLPEGTSPPATHHTWHHGVALRSVSVATDGPLTGWHVVTIANHWPRHAEILVDGELVFNEMHQVNYTGTGAGFGCMEDAAGPLAFDYYEVWLPSPVEESSWGRVKALYRERTNEEGVAASPN